VGKLQKLDDRLGQVEEQIRLGETHLNRQRKIVGDLEQSGLTVASAAAKVLLRQFEEIQQLHLIARERLLTQLTDIKLSQVPNYEYEPRGSGQGQYRVSSPQSVRVRAFYANRLSEVRQQLTTVGRRIRNRQSIIKILECLGCRNQASYSRILLRNLELAQTSLLAEQEQVTLHLIQPAESSTDARAIQAASEMQATLMSLVRSHRRRSPSYKH